MWQAIQGGPTIAWLELVIGTRRDPVLARQVTDLTERLRAAAHQEFERLAPGAPAECRARLAASVARLEDRLPSPSWQALGHLVDERLFHDDAHEGLELFGAGFLRHLFGVEHGVGRLEIHPGPARAEPG